MNHTKFKLLVSSYVDGEVNERERGEVHAHLEECAECREFVDHARLMRKGICALGEVKLPVSFAAHVAHSVERKEEITLEWLGIEPLARNTFIVLTGFVLLLFIVTRMNSETAVSVNDQLMNRITSSSHSTRILLQQDHLSKSDLLYAVMTK